MFELISQLKRRLNEAVVNFMLTDEANRIARFTLGVPIAEARISNAMPTGCRA